MNGLTELNKNFGFLPVFLIMICVTNFYGLGFYMSFLMVGICLYKMPVVLKELDMTFFLIGLFGFVYSAIYLTHPEQGFQYFLAYLITMPAFYILGKHFANSFAAQHHLVLSLLLLGILFGLPALISVWLNIISGGFAQFDRSIPMFWGGDPVGATGMGANFIFIMSFLGILITYGRNLTWFYKVILVGVLILSIGAVLRIGSRTQLGILALNTMMALGLNLKNQSLKQNVFSIGILVIIVLTVVANLALDFDNELFTAFETRMKNDGADDLSSGGGRVALWEGSINLMGKFPFGWSIDRIGYSHNLWLDSYRVGGFPSFLMLLVVTINFILALIRVVNSTQIIFGLKLVLASYALGYFSLFFVEPGIDGMFTGFLFFMFLYGVVTKTQNKQLISDAP